MRRLAEFLGLRRDVILLLAAILLFATGEETWMRFVPKYLEALGAPILVIGLYDALKTFLGAAYALPGGALSDAWGSRRALLFFSWLSISGYVVVLVVAHWAAVLAATFLFLAWSSLSLPASFSVVAQSLPASKHSMGIGVQSLIRRIPVLIGPVVGGMLMDRFGMVQGTRTGIAICIAFGLVAAIMQSWMRASPVIASGVRMRLRESLRAFPPELRRLLVSDILIRFCERIPFAWVVIYAMDHLSASATQVGLLTAVEMTAAMLCYVPASYLADRYGKEPFVVATFVFFTLFPLSLLWASGFAGLLLAFAVRGLKEFGEPARKALIILYSKELGHGRGIGTYYFLRDTTVTAGSLLGAWLWSLGPAVNLAGAFAVGLCGTVFYAITASRPRA